MRLPSLKTILAVEQTEVLFRVEAPPRSASCANIRAMLESFRQRLLLVGRRGINSFALSLRRSTVRTDSALRPPSAFLFANTNEAI